jgi:Tc5 transposase DNA-binding domain
MEQALDALKAQERPNFKKTAEVFGVNRTTLMMRFKGQRVSREEHRKLLTNAQEDELLYHVDQLTLLGLPPTPQMLKNFVEEINKQPVGERWIRRFRQRHANRIDSLYLRAINQTYRPNP